jgi:hypothetical protein
MLCSKAVMFSEGGLCCRHDIGKAGGRVAGFPWRGVAVCPATERVPASVIRTLTFNTEYELGRLRSVLAANISIRQLHHARQLITGAAWCSTIFVLA